MHGGRNVLSSLLALQGVTRLQSAAIGEGRAGVAVPRDTLACHHVKPCARVLVATQELTFTLVCVCISGIVSPSSTTGLNW